MAVHANRHLTDSQYITPVGVIQDQYGIPYLLAETLNIQHQQDADKRPPMLMIALPESTKQAWDLGYEMSISQNTTQKLRDKANVENQKKTEVLNSFKENIIKDFTSNELYGIAQYSQSEAKNLAEIFENTNKGLVANTFGGGAVKEGKLGPQDVILSIGNEISNGQAGHVYKLIGFIPTSHDAEQNVFDGYQIDMPDPKDPAKTIKRDVVVGSAMGMTQQITPQQAINQIFEHDKNDPSFRMQFNGTYTAHTDNSVVMASKRVILEDINLVEAKEVRQNQFENTNPAYANVPVRGKNILDTVIKDGYRSMETNMAVKNEITLATSEIPTVTDPDPTKRTNGIRTFHSELGRAIEEYTTMRKEQDGRSYKNSGLVLDVWSKAPSDDTKNGARNGYKNRQGFGMYVDLQDQSTLKEYGGDRDAPGLDIIRQLSDIVHLRDKATIDYLGPHKEHVMKEGKPPVFDYNQSTHSKLRNHFNKLIRSEINAVVASAHDYVLKTPPHERETVEFKQIERIADRNSGVSEKDKAGMVQDLLRISPTMGEKVLSSARIDQSIRKDITRTANAIVDIEKKYAANTGLRAIFLAERDSADKGPITLNPDNKKLGVIPTPEWFHTSRGGLTEAYFRDTLLPTRQLTINMINPHTGMEEKKTLINLPRANSIYGEMMKDMAAIRDDNAQEPDAQMKRILTNPTFQINTVTRTTDPNSARFNDWYNGRKKDSMDGKTLEEQQTITQQFNKLLEQVQPSVQNIGQKFKSEAQKVFEKTEMQGMAASFGNVANLSTVVENVVARTYTQGPEVDSRLMNRAERMNASSFGNKITRPAPAPSPHFKSEDGTLTPVSNSPGDFAKLEGKKVSNIHAGIDVVLTQGYLGSPNARFTTVPNIQSTNPMTNVQHLNEQVRDSLHSVALMYDRQTPALGQLQELGVVAVQPIAHVQNLQYAYYTMQKDINDVSNTRRPDYDNSLSNDGGGRREHDGPVVDVKFDEEDKTPSLTNDEMKRIQEKSMANAVLAMDDFDISAPSTPAAAVKVDNEVKEVKKPSSSVDFDIGSP